MGVREYWLVDPVHEQARFFRLASDGLFADVTPAPGEAFASEAVTGFRLDPAVVLRKPLPKESAFLRELLG